MSTKMLYETTPAVAGLNKVSGFDPRRFLRKMIKFRTKEEVLDIELKYKKLWFRLEHPSGRLKVTALKITEQLAIMEAKVYFSKEDSEPAATFIAHTSKEIDGPLYIEYAQYAAADESLSDAGFGCQFNDVRNGRTPEFSDKVIPQKAESATVITEDIKQPDKTEIAGTSPSPQPEQTQVQDEPEPPAQEPSVETVQQEVNEDVPEAEESADPPEEIPDLDETETGETKPNLQTATAVISQQEAGFEEITDLEEQPDQNTAPPPRFTADMPVDEICELMTLEEAGALIVDNGYCKDWTLADVAVNRPASLKWYLRGYSGDNNILRAGAKLLLEGKTEDAAA